MSFIINGCKCKYHTAFQKLDEVKELSEALSKSLLETSYLLDGSLYINI